MKRCCILLSGLYRNINNMNNIIDKIITPNPTYQFDIIFSTWDIKYIDCNSDCTSNINENKFITINENELINIYNPVEYSVLDYKKFFNHLNDLNIRQQFIKNNHNIDINDRTIERTIFQFYICEKAILTLEEYEKSKNIKYDVIIRYRFDLFCNENILLDNYNLNIIHGIKKNGCIPDWLFIGNNENMKKLMKVYNKIENNTINYDSPENIFYKNMDNNILFDIPNSFYLNKFENLQY